MPGSQAAGSTSTDSSPAATDPAPDTARPTRVLFLGDFGGGNLGNEASLAAAVAELRSQEPGVEIVVACSEPRSLRLHQRLRAIALRPDFRGIRRLPVGYLRIILDLMAEPVRLARAFGAVRRVDIVVVPGTGILDDFGLRPWQMPLTLFTWTLAARLSRRPFAFSAIGAGPIENPLSRRLFLAAASMSVRVTYRDQDSRVFMSLCGRDVSHDLVRTDLAFATAHDRLRSGVFHGDEPTVGLGVMSYGGWSGRTEGPRYDAYLELIDAIIDGVVERGYRVLFLVGQPNDYQAVRDLADRAARRGLTKEVLEEVPIEDFSTLLATIGRTDCVIATRFHNVVAAIMMEKSAISLSYAPKNAQLFVDIGMPPVDRPIDQATPEWVLTAFDDLSTHTAFVEACRSPGMQASRLEQVRQEMADLLSLARSPHHLRQRHNSCRSAR